MPYRLNDMPEWVGIAVRYPDGRIDAYELRGNITGQMTWNTEVDASWLLGDRPDILHRRVSAHFEATEATRWRQGADATPRRQEAIEPTRKAIES